MFTYSDALEYLVTHLGGGADDRAQARCRVAVNDAYRRIAQHPKGWRYYITKSRVNLNGLYQTGTVTYVASTRTFTLSGGTFPSWAANGEIRLGTRSYEVETNPTGTTVVIGTLNAPTEDLAAPQEYSLVQVAYPLPTSFQDVYWVEGDNNWSQEYVDPTQWYSIDRTSASVGDPIYWSVLGDSNQNSYSGKSLYVYPAPVTSAPHEFLMRRKARQLRYSGQSAAEFAGTISISGTTVTGVGTSFASRMIGSVLRVTDGPEVPTGLGGLEPYTDEFVIKSVTNGTSLTLATSSATTYSTARYRISDPLDIDDCMESALRAGVDWEYAKVASETDAELNRRRQVYLEELTRAWEIDTLRGIDRAGIPFYGNETGSRFYMTNYTIER